MSLSTGSTTDSNRGTLISEDGEDEVYLNINTSTIYYKGAPPEETKQIKVQYNDSGDIRVFSNRHNTWLKLADDTNLKILNEIPKEETERVKREEALKAYEGL